MARRVGWKGRREVGPVEIAGRRAERHEGRISHRGGVAVALAGGAAPLVSLADAGDRTPEPVAVLRLPDRDTGVSHRHVDQRQKPRELDDIGAHLVGDVQGDLVVEPRRCTEARGSIVGPVNPGLGLFRGSLRRSHEPIATQTLGFVERGRVLHASHRGRGWNPELIGRPHHERCDRAPARAQCERDLADRILAPLPRFISRDEVHTDAGLRVLRAVAGAQGENGGGGPLPQGDALDLGAALGNPPEVFFELLVEARPLRGKELDQRIVRGLGDGGPHGGPVARGGQAGVAPITADDRVHRIEDRNMDDRHRATRAPRPQVLAKDPLLAGLHRRVVEPTGVNGDRVPVVYPAPRGLGPP